MVFLSLKFWRRSRKKNNKRHFLYQVSKRTVGGFKHHPLPGALPVWEIIKIPFPSMAIKPEWGMQRGLPLSSLKFNLPARPQQNSWGNAGGSQRAGKHRQEPYPGGEPTGGCTGLQVLPVPETAAKLHCLKSTASPGGDTGVGNPHVETWDWVLEFPNTKYKAIKTV